MHPSKLALDPTVAHSLPERRSKVTRYIMARNRMRSSGRHSNETTKSNERKDEERERERCRGKKVRLWKGKKRRRRRGGGGRNVEMQTDGVLRSSLVSRLRKLPEELPEALQPGRA